MFVQVSVCPRGGVFQHVLGQGVCIPACTWAEGVCGWGVDLGCEQGVWTGGLHSSMTAAEIGVTRPILFYLFYLYMK